jgi:formate dehydrogenase subunit gamma
MKLTPIQRAAAMGLALLALALGTPAWAQAPAAVPLAADAAAAPAAPAAKGPPAGFVAQAEPKADENNALRAKTQPGNNAPLWRAVRESGNTEGVNTLPGSEKGVLIQSFTQYPGSRLSSAGEAWRQVRNNWLIPYGGALMAILAVSLGLFHWKTGGMGGHHESAPTGRVIERFTYLERVSHWTVAICFVLLAVSGIVMAFGKFFLLPVLGGTLFGWLSYALKTAHNFAGPLFAAAMLVFIVTYIRDNIPAAHDLKWMLRVKGMITGHEEPSGKFNAGEKVVFWGGVIVLGLAVIGSGLVLDKLVPGLGELRSQMQIAHLVHAVASLLMMTLFMVHIYMGTLGLSGAYQAMRTGYVDESWAKDHHQLWYDDIQAGRVPAHRTPGAQPPPALQTAPH